MAKFKLDEWVAVRGASKTWKAHILAIREETCEAGTQISYKVRCFHNDGREQFEYPGKSGHFMMEETELELF